MGRECFACCAHLRRCGRLRYSFPRGITLSRLYFFTALLAIALTGGCKAQSAAPAANASLNRSIEVAVRTQFGVAPKYDLTIGARKPSTFPGYDSLTVTVSYGERKTDLDFLISADNKNLVRMDTFDLTKNPSQGIDIAGRPARGDAAAKITLINYDDLECPYCARLHSTLFPVTLDHYKGLVKVVYKDNPLFQIHPWALHAAVDANCLAAQSGDAYWAFVDYIHAHGQEVNGEDRNLPKSFDALNRIARQQGLLNKLDAGKLDGCMAAQDETKVRASVAEAEALHVDGAPALFIDGELVHGAVSAPELWKAIDRALRAQGIQPPVDQPQAAPAAPAQGK